MKPCWHFTSLKQCNIILSLSPNSNKLEWDQLPIELKPHSPCLKKVSTEPPKQQDEMLDWPRTLISLSNTRNENHKILEQPWRHFTCLKLCLCSQIPQLPPRVTSISNRTKTNTSLIIYKHTTRTKLNHLTHRMTEGKLPHPLDNTKKSWTYLLPSFLWLIPKTKRWNLRFTQHSHFV